MPRLPGRFNSRREENEDQRMVTVSAIEQSLNDAPGVLTGEAFSMAIHAVGGRCFKRFIHYLIISVKEYLAPA
ncbi:hypothetical protein Pvag_2336 [Pantoea vagans C9-1]|nr:hypothetical protein Pvag_2336 [Pantoea vagans C9-1]